MYRFIRPLLFQLDAERAHDWTLQLLRLSGRVPPFYWLIRSAYLAPPQPVSVFGLEFRNPVGLAAGFDKNGLGWRGLSALGFGHIEIGTVTLKPQIGNPKPRVFRLPEDQAIINRLGFPGKGVDFVAKRLKGTRTPVPVIGVNIGKNKDTPNEEAANDYLALMRRFVPIADYLTINVSSPNTIGLRRLQAREALENLLGQIAEARKTFASTPILVKIAPDLTDQELEDSVGAIVSASMDGIIATNTTTAREGLRSRNAGETGGLSGAPLTQLSTTILEKIVRMTQGAVPVVAVGGIMTPEDARKKLDAGAALVQVYSGLVYHGPGLVKAIVRSLQPSSP